MENEASHLSSTDRTKCGINAELIKYGGNELCGELCDLFYIIVKHNDIPQSWRDSWLIPIHKKGDKNKPDNYRGITLMNSITKLFTSVILEKLRVYYENREEQFGFRRNRSTTNAIYILSQIKEKAIEFNTPAYLCFVDMKKVFDSIKIEDIVGILIENRVPNSLIKVIYEVNTKLKTRIRTNIETSADINMNRGIRQGDSLSPYLFNMVMDKIIHEITSMTIGYQLGKKTLLTICSKEIQSRNL